MASVDALRIEQVLTNLLDNAVKYSPRRRPIEVVLASRHADRASRCRVRDHGLGIPVDKRARIFERFYPGSRERLRQWDWAWDLRQPPDRRAPRRQIRAEFPADGGTRIVVDLPVRTELEI